MAGSINFRKLQSFSEKHIRGAGKVMMMTEEVAPIGIKFGDQSCWLWGGNVFDSAGQPVPETHYPRWLMQEACKCGDKKLEAVGWLGKVKEFRENNSGPVNKPDFDEAQNLDYWSARINNTKKRGRPRTVEAPK